MLDDFRQKLGKMRPQFVDDPGWYTEILIHFMLAKDKYLTCKDTEIEGIFF